MDAQRGERRIRRAGRAGAIALALLPPLLAGAPAARAGPDPLEAGRQRLEDLAALFRKDATPEDDLTGAIAALADAYARVLGGRPPPAGPPGKEEDRFARAVETALLRIVGAPPRDPRAKEDDRHAARVAALRALRGMRPSTAAALRTVLEEQVYRGPGPGPFPSFHDEAFETLLRLDPDGSWPWILEEGVNCENDPASMARNLAALDALRRFPRPDAARRVAGVRRLVSIFQAPDAFWNDWYQDLTGVRHVEKKMGKWWYGQFWLDIRDPVIETLRALATDPVTGLPPLDPDDGTEMFLVRRYIVWQARNRPQAVAPWVDRKEPAEPGALPPRRKVSPLDLDYGIPWERWWRENRRLSRPAGLTSAGEAFDREAHRTRVLPGLLAPFLDDADPGVRAAAAVQLGRTGAEGAGLRLRGLLGPGIPRVVREGAALGLLVHRDPADRDFLRIRASDPSEAPRVRAAAILALGAIGDRARVREEFLEKAEGVPEDLGACAVAALGLAGDAVDGPLLASILADRGRPDPVRGEAGTALLRVRDPSAAETLRRVLAENAKGRERHVPQVAAALAWAGTAAPDDRRGWAALRAWFERYDDRFGGARNALVAGLGGMRGPLVGRFLAERYGDVLKDRRRPAEIGFHLLALGLQGSPEATALLRKGLEGDLDHERDLGACVLGLALAGDGESAAAIQDLLERSGRYAVAPSMLALGILGHRDAVPVVRRIVERRRDGDVLENGALALALLLGPGAMDDLAALWERCGDPELFDGLAEAFRVAGAPRAVEWLRARAGDASLPSFERAAALSALGRMGMDAEGTVLDRLARDHDPYAGAETLDGIARHRDLAPLRTAER